MWISVPKVVHATDTCKAVRAKDLLSIDEMGFGSWEGSSNHKLRKSHLAHCQRRGSHEFLVFTMLSPHVFDSEVFLDTYSDELTSQSETASRLRAPSKSILSILRNLSAGTGFASTHIIAVIDSPKR